MSACKRIAFATENIFSAMEEVVCLWLKYVTVSMIARMDLMSYALLIIVPITHAHFSLN